MNILFFLAEMKMLWVSIYLRVMLTTGYYKLPLLHWGIPLIFLVLLWRDAEIYQISSPNEMITRLSLSVYVGDNVYWLAYVEQSLCRWDEANLIMINNLFDVSLNSVCKNFVENFCVYIHQRYWSITSFILLHLYVFGARMIVASQ